MAEIRVGPCGFCLRQEEVFKTFPVMEVQQTFYQPPQLKTVQRWRDTAPADFEFTLKAFQAITHLGGSPTYRRCKLSPAEKQECGFFRDTAVVHAAWDTTRRLAAALQARIVVFQCPAAFRPTEANVANLRRFFGRAERDRLVFGWEPRGPAWGLALVAELCRELDLLHVVDPFVTEPTHGVPRYFRLHGIGGYEYCYSAEELAWLRQQCTGPLTYSMFNNTEMAKDGVRFMGLVETP